MTSALVFSHEPTLNVRNGGLYRQAAPVGMAVSHVAESPENPARFSS